MISGTTIQQAYNNLYIILREYLWDYPSILDIADLETACYKAIPDIDDVRNCLRKVKQNCRLVLEESEDMKEEFESFENLLDSEDSTYANIKVMEEVYDRVDNEAEEL